MAQERSQNQPIASSIGAEAVTAYLRAHPDFLQRHLDLIPDLAAPMIDHGPGVLDFQYFMVERLRSDLRRLAQEQRDLIASSRANLTSQSRIHAGILFILDAQSIEHLIQTITTDLAVLLDLDVACLLIEAYGRSYPRVPPAGLRVVAAGAIDRWLGRKEVVLGTNIIGDPAIFGSGAGLVRSQALIRLHLGPDTPPALLAFGSRDHAPFQAGQGTELMSFLGRVIERCLRSWLEPPA